MTVSGLTLVLTATWVATGLGFGLWLWSWFVEKNAIQKLRLRDCGLVLVFSAILVRILAQQRPMTVFDWILAVIGPIFIAAALWRLGRTTNPAGPG